MSKSSNNLEKQSTSNQFVAQEEKMEIDTPILEAKVSTNTANAPQPKFVNATVMVAAVPDITDEEFLKFALEFEREHGI